MVSWLDSFVIQPFQSLFEWFRPSTPNIMTETHQCPLSWNIPEPWPVEKIKPNLQVFSNDKETMSFDYDEDPINFAEKLKSAKMLSGSHLIFITHGFENCLETPWLPEMKDAILEQLETATVVLVGWGGGADIGILKYTQAAANTQTVGTWLANYVKALKNQVATIKRQEPLYIWGIAHSLGAHLMGIAGRTSKIFNRISGLDPAGPSFEKVNQENRLRSTDAHFVDVIHTDGFDRYFDPKDWFAPVNHYGTLIPIGAIDFYPNWGYCQPGAGIFTLAGSHHRSIELFIWSILNPGKFITNSSLDGVPEFEAPVKKTVNVETEVEMGFWNSTEKRGNYFIQTNSSLPWV